MSRAIYNALRFSPDFVKRNYATIPTPDFWRLVHRLKGRRLKMLLIGIGTYPMQSTKEVAKCMMEIPRLPEYIKGKGNYVYTNEEGAVGLVIYEFDSVKADEAIEQINNAYWRFYDVPGFSFQLIPCSKAREAAQRFLELS
jgi:hypothetical protein